MFFSDRELLRLLPRVLRARDFHLYLEGGKRLTDLWLAGGRAILGHKPARVLGELKNAAERGLFTPLPHPDERRLFKALEVLFPDRSFRLYPDEGSLFRALERAGFAPRDIPPRDPAFPPDTGAARVKGRVSLWRPFLEPEEDSARILIPVLPWPPGPLALVLDKDSENLFPVRELIPPVLLSPAARALYSLAAALKVQKTNRGRYPKIDKALKGGPWRRREIYLSAGPEASGKKYKTLFTDFLEAGFLIPPSREEPVILPASMTGGEESRLAGLLGRGL